MNIVDDQGKEGKDGNNLKHLSWSETSFWLYAWCAFEGIPVDAIYNSKRQMTQLVDSTMSYAGELKTIPTRPRTLQYPCKNSNITLGAVSLCEDVG